MHKAKAIAVTVAANQGLTRAGLLAGLMLAAAFLLMAVPAHAEPQLHYDPAIKSDQMSQAFQQYSGHTKRIDSSWQNPNSFDNMFCGGSLDIAFDGLVDGNVRSIANQINNVIKSQMSQICQQTITLEPLAAGSDIPRQPPTRR